MCVVTENGYQFKCSNRIIPHTGVDLSTLSADEFKELKDTSVDMISQMQIKHSIQKIETKIDSLCTTLDKAIKQSMEAQKKFVVDDDHILNVVESWYTDVIERFADPEHDFSKRLNRRIVNDVKDFVKDTILTSGNIAWALTAITVFVGGIGLVAYLAVKAAQ
jgi:hypothetical protein